MTTEQKITPLILDEYLEILVTQDDQISHLPFAF
jgi:hypothetical protein